MELNDKFPAKLMASFDNDPKKALTYFFTHSDHLDHLSAESRASALKTWLASMENMHEGSIDGFFEKLEDKTSYIYQMQDADFQDIDIQR